MLLENICAILVELLNNKTHITHFMNKKIILILLLMVLLIGGGFLFSKKQKLIDNIVPVTTETVGDFVKTLDNTVTYKSSTGPETVTVVYSPDGQNVIVDAPVLGISGATFKIAESASGARYLSQDGKTELWNKGDEIMINIADKNVFSGKNTTIKKTTCTDNGKTYKEGDVLKEVHDDNGNVGTLADAAYVCTSGEWLVVADGSEGVKVPPAL